MQGLKTVFNNEYPFTAPISLFASRTGEESGTKTLPLQQLTQKQSPKQRSPHRGGRGTGVGCPRRWLLGTAPSPSPPMGRTSSATLTASERTAFSVAMGSPSVSAAASCNRISLGNRDGVGIMSGSAGWIRSSLPPPGSLAPPGHDGGGPNRQPQLTAVTTVDLPPPSPGASEEADIAPQDSSLQPCPDACSASVAYASSRSRIWVRGRRIFVFPISDSDYANMGVGLPTLLDVVFCLCKTQNRFGSLYG